MHKHGPLAIKKPWNKEHTHAEVSQSLYVSVHLYYHIKITNQLPAQSLPTEVPHSQKPVMLDVHWCASSDPAQEHSVQILEEKGGLGNIWPTKQEGKSNNKSCWEEQSV